MNKDTEQFGLIKVLDNAYVKVSASCIQVTLDFMVFQP